MMTKIKWILLRMLLEYLQNSQKCLHLIFKICQIIHAYIVVYMMLKMLFSAKAKIVISGFAMEKAI